MQVIVNLGKKKAKVFNVYLLALSPKADLPRGGG